jgi:O-methyltransferase
MDDQVNLNVKESLISKVAPFTLSDPNRLNNLMNLCNYLNDKDVPGDFVECGVYKGGSAAVISKYLGSKRKLWLYDSFEGMPETTDKDGEAAKKWIGGCIASIEDVHEVMQLVATSSDCYTIKKGWFNQTFEEQIPTKIALLHCDADWYDSVTLVLETFYDLIAEGGCIVLDDFGYWEGCREAFYDFCFRRGEKPLLERLDSTQAYWIKGKLHNRNS